MDMDEIKTIVKLMSDYQLTEFTVEADGCNISIKRGGAAPAAVSLLPAALPAPAPAAAPVSSEAAAPAPEKEVVTVDSPLVGTFYSSPAPDAAPFVAPGDKVTPDTVIGIIEAMKVMNEIKAEKSGVVKEVVAQNGQPVEFGQVLLTLE